ncbi:unnamed protein product [Blepharisma stoltei]|uniref:Uncharacterized protein n=1 Tax=Blepharisma stoltei TaxID=1481888 RepID=A0AAU9ICY2_9CILI|nr:unnamed protein product [Blepharisma stoltei]
MPYSSSCLSFLFCKNNKKRSSKKSSRSTINISSFQEFISHKANSSTQTPSSGDIEFKQTSPLQKLHLQH